MQGKISQRLTVIMEQNDETKLAEQAYKFFKGITPRLTGNAQRRTVLKGSSIVAEYAYATRLDQGYSGKAPEGMVKPTIQHMQQYIRKQR